MDKPMKIVSKKSLMFLLFLLISLRAVAETYSGGVVSENTVWNASGSPYYIESDLIVNNGVTLTLEAGTIVYVSPGVQFLINGGLIINGNELASNTTISGQPDFEFEGSWNGIEISETGNIDASFLTLKFAEVGLTINSPSESNSIYHSVISTNNEGITGTGFLKIDKSEFIENYRGVVINNAVISFSEFRNNTCGVLATEPSVVKISNSFFTKNKTGVYNLSQVLNMTGNVLKENETGIETVSFVKENSSFVGNKLCFNSQYNLKLLSKNNIEISNNCWCSFNPEEIAENIYDSTDYNKVGKVSVDLSDSCNGIDQYAVNKVSGKVFSGDSLMKDGIVLLYENIRSYPVSWVKVKDGKFTFFRNYQSSPYLYIYAVPNPQTYQQYLPTFKGDEIEWENAQGVYVSNNVEDIKINLVNIEPEHDGSIAYRGRIMYDIPASDLKTAYQSSWFKPIVDPGNNSSIPRQATVFVHRPDGQIVEWFLTDFTGDFQFTAREQGYYISVQRPGMILTSGGTFSNSAGGTEFYLTSMQMATGNAKSYSNSASPDAIANDNQDGLVEKVSSLEIINALGQVVRMSSYESYCKKNLETYTKDLEAGWYTARFYNVNGIEIVRFIIP